jgi:ankyrin repeat protein
MQWGSDVRAVNKNGMTLLHDAAALNLIGVAKFLVSKGANVNVQGMDNLTPLMVAVVQGSIEVAKFLISVGADVNAKHITGGTSLDIARGTGNMEMVRLLSDTSGMSAEPITFTATEQAKIDEFLRHYRQYKGDVKAVDKDGHTLLYWAALASDIVVVKFLVSKGADVNSKDNDGQSPIHVVASGGENANIEIAKFLISNGADVNARNNIGSTPLDAAKLMARFNQSVAAMVQYLSSIGARSGY